MADMSPIEAEFITWNYATAKLMKDKMDKAVRDYGKFIKNNPSSEGCLSFIEGNHE